MTIKFSNNVRFLKLLRYNDFVWCFRSTINDSLVNSLFNKSQLLFTPQLRNGPDASSPPLGQRLCGASPPSNLQTTDNHLFIQFVSDASNEASGFKLIFEAHSQGTTTCFFLILSDMEFIITFICGCCSLCSVIKCHYIIDNRLCNDIVWIVVGKWSVGMCFICQQQCYYSNCWLLQLM